MRKRLWSILLALCMMLSLLPVGASAAKVVDSGECGENVTWTLTDDGVLTISGTGDMTDYGDAGMTWTREKIESAVIQPGVTSIGDCAFSSCRIKKFSIPDSVRRIGNGAFYGCTDFETITIPKNVSQIGDEVFSGSNDLKEITVDTNNKYYKSVDGVLLDKAETTLIACPAKKTGAFQIPTGVKTICASAFLGCSELTNITILSTVTRIGDWAFAYCDRLTAFAIPAGVTTIPDGAFSGCKSLESVKIPSSVNKIEDYAFFKCDALTDVYYGGSEAQWKEVQIGKYGNDPLAKLTDKIHYESSGPEGAESTPTPTTKPTFTVPSKNIYLKEKQDVVVVKATLPYADAVYLKSCMENIKITTADTKMKTAEKIVVAENGKSAELIFTLDPNAAQKVQYNIWWDPEGLDGETVFVYGNKSESDNTESNYFVIGKDSNNFVHVSEHMGTDMVPNGVGTAYSTSLYYYNKLVKGMSNAKVGELLDIMYQDSSGGSCHGLAVSLGLANIGKLDVRKLERSNKEPTCYNDLSAPVTNYPLRSLINYYQLLEYMEKNPEPEKMVMDLSHGIPFMEGGITSGGSLKEFWNSFTEAVQEAVKKKVPLLFGIAYDDYKGKPEGHALLVCGYSETENAHIVKIYDCNYSSPACGAWLNNPEIVPDYLYLFIDKDKPYFWFSTSKNGDEPFNYYSSNDNWKQFSYYSINSWNQYDVSIEEPVKAKTKSALSGENYISFTIDAEARFKIKNSENQYLQLKNGRISGDMAVHSFKVLGDYSSFRFYIPVSDELVVTDFEDNTSIGVNYGDSYYSVKAENTNEIIFNRNRGVVLSGNDLSYRIGLLEETDGSLILVKGYGSNDCSITDLGDSFLFYAENTEQVEINKIDQKGEKQSASASDVKLLSITTEGTIENSVKNDPDNPAILPSAQPTAQPTTAPSVQPTVQPSAKPSPEPSAKPVSTKFVDVADDVYYADAVRWAVEHNPQITNGVDSTHFAPNRDCTRAQMVTFLWRAAGEPKPESTRNPFTDVKKGGYYYDAVLWAVEQGITTGTGKTTFSPDAVVTRAQTVTFLWRMEGEPAVKTKNPFTDVKSGQYYTDAILWAAKNHITTGITATTFGPGNPCTRAQIVTFLWRAMA